MSEEEILLFPTGIIKFCKYILDHGLEEGKPNDPGVIKGCKELIEYWRREISPKEYVELVQEGILE